MKAKLVPAKFIGGRLQPIQQPSKAARKITSRSFTIGSFGSWEGNEFLSTSETLHEINEMLRNKPKSKPRIEQWLEGVIEIPLDILEQT